MKRFDSRRSWFLLTLGILLVVLAATLRMVVTALLSPSPLNILAVEIGFLVAAGIVLYLRLGNIDVENDVSNPHNRWDRTRSAILKSIFLIAIAIGVLSL